MATPPAIWLVIKTLSCWRSSRRPAHAVVKSWIYDTLSCGERKSCLLVILARALHFVMIYAASEAWTQGKQAAGDTNFTMGSEKGAPEEGIMKAQTSFASPGYCRCPVCGASQAGMTSAARNRSFACSRCHIGLQVTESPSLAVLSGSILISLFLSFALGLRVVSFTLILVGATAVFNWLGQSIRRLVVVPRITVRPKALNPASPRTMLSTHRPARSSKLTYERGSLRCPLVVTHD
jgi:hypothetical protein